jgi:cytochrome c oxidase subunit IV
MDMRRRLLRLVLTWVLLLILLGIEYGISRLPLGPSMGPVVLVPAVLMAGLAGLLFMEVRRGPQIVRLFAVASLLWLTILLGLGSLDPLTRVMYYVQASK